MFSYVRLWDIIVLWKTRCFFRVWLNLLKKFLFEIYVGKIEVYAGKSYLKKKLKHSWKLQMILLIKSSILSNICLTFVVKWIDEYIEKKNRKTSIILTNYHFCNKVIELLETVQADILNKYDVKNPFSQPFRIFTFSRKNAK